MEKLSQDTKDVLSITTKKLHKAIKDRRTKDPVVHGTGYSSLENMVKVIASTCCKEAWQVLIGCYADEEYAIINNSIGVALSTTLSEYHCYNKPTTEKAAKVEPVDTATGD